MLEKPAAIVMTHRGRDDRSLRIFSSISGDMVICMNDYIVDNVGDVVTGGAGFGVIPASV